jgi:hypothetical protein
MAILVISNIVHFYSVAFLTATTALKQLDREFEMVSESMGVSFARTFTRVTVPICVPAILEIGMFYFVNAMATVSAVIFLYSADHAPGLGGGGQHGRCRRHRPGLRHVHSYRADQPVRAHRLHHPDPGHQKAKPGLGAALNLINRI